MNCFLHRRFCVIHGSKPPCTVTIDSVKVNSKTQHALLFPVYAMFRHDCPLTVKPASTPWRLVHKKPGEILYLLICSFLLCLSWFLRSRVRNFRRDLWITPYSFFYYISILDNIETLKCFWYFFALLSRVDIIIVSEILIVEKSEFV
jgi:hypothetical protein